MSAANTLTAADCDNYALPDIDAPEDLNADARPFEDAPPGSHIMEIHDFEIVADESFKIKGEQFILDQIRPKLRVVEGQPHAGASAMDFLPMPTGPMHTMLANRWANFIKRCGFNLPQGKLVPPGFHPKQLIGRRVRVDLQIQTDADGNAKTKRNGEPLIGVKLFGYDYADSKAPATATATATTPKPATATAASKAEKAKAAQDFEL